MTFDLSMSMSTWNEMNDLMTSQVVHCLKNIKNPINNHSGRQKRERKTSYFCTDGWTKTTLLFMLLWVKPIMVWNCLSVRRFNYFEFCFHQWTSFKVKGNTETSSSKVRRSTYINCTVYVCVSGFHMQHVLSMWISNQHWYFQYIIRTDKVVLKGVCYLGWGAKWGSIVFHQLLQKLLLFFASLFVHRVQ